MSVGHVLTSHGKEHLMCDNDIELSVGLFYFEDGWSLTERTARFIDWERFVDVCGCHPKRRALGNLYRTKGSSSHEMGWATPHKHLKWKNKEARTIKVSGVFLVDQNERVFSVDFFASTIYAVPNQCVIYEVNNAIYKLAV